MSTTENSGIVAEFHQMSEGSPAQTTTSASVGPNREPVDAEITGTQPSLTNAPYHPSADGDPHSNPGCVDPHRWPPDDGSPAAREFQPTGPQLDPDEEDLFKYLFKQRKNYEKKRLTNEEEDDRCKGPYGVFYNVVRNVRRSNRVYIPSILTPLMVPEPLQVLNRRTNEVFHLPRLERQSYESYEQLEWESKAKIRSKYNFGQAPPKRHRRPRQKQRDAKFQTFEFVRQGPEDGFMINGDNFIGRMNERFFEGGRDMSSEVEWVFSKFGEDHIPMFSCHVRDKKSGHRTLETTKFPTKKQAKQDAARIWLQRDFEDEPESFVLQGLEGGFHTLFMNETPHSRFLEDIMMLLLGLTTSGNYSTMSMHILNFIKLTFRDRVRPGGQDQDSFMQELSLWALHLFGPRASKMEHELDENLADWNMSDAFTSDDGYEERESDSSSDWNVHIPTMAERLERMRECMAEQKRQNEQKQDEEISIERQGLEDFINLFSAAEDTGIRPRQKSFLFGKVMKLFTIIAAMGLYAKSNIPFGPELFRIVEHSWFSTFKFTANIFTDAMEIVSYLCKQGWLVYSTGTFDSLWHTPANYKSWLEKCILLERRSGFLASCEAHGFTIFDFHFDLSSALLEGELMLKKLKVQNDSDVRLVEVYLGKLKTMDMELRTVEYCQEVRIPPFSVLVVGHTSIGKSSIREILLRQFAFTRGLPYKSEYIFNVNAEAKFWDGFRSHMWAISMDDVARYSVKACQAGGGDPTLKTVLDVVNNTPFIPDQAHLNDKGRTPVKSEICIATTNTKNLNAEHYYTYSSAITRRFPFVITPKVQQRYAKTDNSLDSSKVPVSDPRTFPDLWTWTVERVEARGKTTVYVKVLDDVAIAPFMQWYVNAIKEHFANQAKVTAMRNTFASMKRCTLCTLPFSLCGCAVPDFQVQSDEDFLSLFHVVLFIMGVIAAGLVTTGTLALRSFSRDMHHVGACLDKASDQVGVFNDHVAEYGRNSTQIIMNVRSVSASLHEISDSIAEYGNRSARIIANFQSATDSLESVAAVADDITSLREKFGAMGERARAKLPHPRFLLSVGACVVTVLAAVKLYSLFSAKPTFASEGAPFSLPSKNEKEAESVWKKDDYPTEKIAISDASRCMQGANLINLTKRVEKQTVILHATPGVVSDKTSFRGFCSGEYVITSAHCVPDKPFDVEVFFVPADGNLSHNQRFKVVPYQVAKDVDSDLCVIKLSGLRPFKRLDSFFALEKHMQSAPGSYFRREPDGSVTDISLDRMSRLTVDDPLTSKPVKVWSGHASLKTERGNCGMPLILHTSIGPALAGTHFGGSKEAESKYVVASILTKERFDKLCASLKTRQVNLCELHGLGDVGSFLVRIPDYPDEGEVRLDGIGCSITLGPLHQKAPMRFIEERGELEVFGSLVGFRSSHTSDVEKTPMYQFFKDRNFYSDKVRPDLVTWKPKRLCLLDSTAASNCIDQEQLDLCVFTFAQDILTNIDASELGKIGPLSLPVAINGAPGVSYIDSINKSTSCGFPWRKSKTHLLVPRDPDAWELAVGYSIMWDPTLELTDRIDDLRARYLLGMRSNPVFCAQLKDEPISEAKAAVGKTRVFVSAPVHFTILVRQILLPFVRLVQNNKFLFESGPGTAAQSSEWEDIFKYLTRFGHGRIIAGDYSAFDKKMAAQVVRGAMTFILIICLASGAFSEDDLKILVGICSDVNFPMCDFFGDLIRFLSTNPSGWPLTVILNGIVNCIYMRLAYLNLNPEREVTSFKENVALITYGDDNAAGVCEKAQWFNHSAISVFLGTIGVKYTMAEKERESVPYINISECSFLKRKWRWEPDLDCHTCPLEVDSIKKQLTVWVRSKVLTEKAHCVSTLFSAHWELFFHGREFFDAWDPVFKEAVIAHDLTVWMPEGGFPSWDQYCQKWKIASRLFVSSFDKMCHHFGEMMSLGSGSLAGAFSQAFYDESVGVLKTAGINVIISPLCEELVKYILTQNFGWKISGLIVGGGEFGLYLAAYLRSRGKGGAFEAYSLPAFMLARLVPLVGHFVTAKLHENHSKSAVVGHVLWNFLCFSPAIFSGLIGITDQNFIYESLVKAHESGAKIDPKVFTDWDCGCPWAASWLELLSHEPKIASVSSYLAPRIMRVVKLWSERRNTVDGEQTSRVSIRNGSVLPTRHLSTCSNEFILQGNEQLAETLTNFDDSVAPVQISASVPTSAPKDSGVTLENWFQRPILIKTIKWHELNVKFEEFFPWDLYFNTPSVNQKLRGYSRMRARLHIKVIVNCSPFRFAKAMMSYRPLGDPLGNDKTDTSDPCSYFDYQKSPFCFSGGMIDPRSTPSVNLEAGLLARSQRPHFLIDMAQNLGGEMVLPFIYHSDWFDCTYSQVARPSLQEENLWFPQLRRLGMLTFESMQSLQSVAAASSDPATISIYAWCDDLELAGASLQRQGGDDYAARPVSTVASAVAAATGALSALPVIGPYMRATSIFATGISSVARWFGFSNPPVIDPVGGRKIMTAANLASPEISTQIEKLALDPKHEVNIDPRTVGGTSQDELLIKAFTNRRTYIFQTAWNTYDDQGTNLATFYVTPEYYYGFNSSTGPTGDIQMKIWQLTPLAHVCQWFKFWRGSMKYHFKVVKTQFHRGRLRITYDPAGTYSNFSEGLLHTQIVDISEVDEFDFEIPYLATRPWLKTTQAPYVATAYKYFNSRGNPGPLYDDMYMNGMVRVEVLNELGSMDSTSSVALMVYACGGDDFELAAPVCFNAGTTTDVSYTEPFNLESGEELVSAKRVDERVISSTMGEAVVSLRQLMHRAMFYGTLVCNEVNGSTTQIGYLAGKIPRCLRFGGASDFPNVDDALNTNANTGNFHKTGSSKGYNYLAMLPIPYFESCFVGKRGGTVLRCLTRNQTTGFAALKMYLTIGRSDEIALANKTLDLVPAGSVYGDARSKQFLELIDSSASGMMMQSNEHGMADADVPHYSQYYMLPANPCLVTSAGKNAVRERFGMDTDGVELTLSNAVSQGQIQIDVYAHGSVDYQAFVFLNVPTFYTTATPSATSG